MATRTLILLGTRQGAFVSGVCRSDDGGRSWQLLADFLPGISSIETVTLDD